MTLHQIITALQNTSGNNDKLAILEANKDNDLLRDYMKAMLDPAINYYQSKLPKFTKENAAPRIPNDFGFVHLYDLATLAERKVTGNEAKEYLANVLANSSDEAVELVNYIIKRKIDGANVGETMVLKVWPDLFFVPPYMRCAGLDDKIKKHYAGQPVFYVQTKRDGSFAYLQNSLEGTAKAITRQGSHYPIWFADRMVKGIPKGAVLIGEMEVYVKKMSGSVLMARKDGNGVLNSVLQGADLKELGGDYSFRYVAWDMISEKEFKSGKSNRQYSERWFNLQNLLQNAPMHLQLVEHHEVKSFEEAYKIYSDHTERGLEGVVIKTTTGVWRDSSSGTKDAVKMKLVFEAEYEIVDTYEGEGKAAGMLGGIVVKTSCGKLTNNCGSGFSDKQRKELWAIRDELPGQIVTLEANDILSARGRDTLSLSLPIFIEIRKDKKEADSLERVLQQLDAAKKGK